MDQPSRRHFYQLVARSRRGPILLNTRRLVFIGLSLVSGLLLSSPISTGVMDTASNPAQTIEPAAVIPSGFTEAQVAGGLVNPTAMTFAPDGRLFVCQQGGALRVIKNGALLSTPFVTVTVNSSGERGLLGVAFDPDFVNNNFVYVYYTATTPAIHNRVSRFTANGDVAAPGSEVVILELNNLSDATHHNGGAIHFGDDGKLYIAVGENVNGANSQTLANLLGKVLRINPDGTIPSDNPFFNTATGNNRAIWALGLRNPFTFAFQPGTGRMFINDVGQNTTEEINDGIEGSNYGWPDTEGPTSDPRFRGPIFSYGHGSSSTTGCAIAGAAFYNPRTPQFPTEFIGDYFFADLCSGWIRRFDTLTQTAMGFATNISNPVDLQVSSDGALYYLARGSGSNTGVVFKIEHTDGGGDTTPPFTSGHAPSPGATGVPVNTNIVVHVEDAGVGVDVASIVMKVEGAAVTQAVTGSAADFTLTYNPPVDFALSQMVDVTVDAKDLAGNVMPTDKYSFTTGATQGSSATLTTVIHLPDHTPLPCIPVSSPCHMQVAPGGSVVHDLTTVTSSDATKIPTGTIDLRFFGSTDDCNGGQRILEEIMTLGGTGGVTDAESTSIGPLGAGGYSYRVKYQPDDAAKALGFLASTSPCERLTVLPEPK